MKPKIFAVLMTSFHIIFLKNTINSEWPCDFWRQVCVCVCVCACAGCDWGLPILGLPAPLRFVFCTYLLCFISVCVAKIWRGPPCMPFWIPSLGIDLRGSEKDRRLKLVLVSGLVSGLLNLNLLQFPECLFWKNARNCLGKMIYIQFLDWRRMLPKNKVSTLCPCG